MNFRLIVEFIGLFMLWWVWLVVDDHSINERVWCFDYVISWKSFWLSKYWFQSKINHRSFSIDRLENNQFFSIINFRSLNFGMIKWSIFFRLNKRMMYDFPFSFLWSFDLSFDWFFETDWLVNQFFDLFQPINRFF